MVYAEKAENWNGRCYFACCWQQTRIMSGISATHCASSVVDFQFQRVNITLCC